MTYRDQLVQETVRLKQMAAQIHVSKELHKATSQQLRALEKTMAAVEKQLREWTGENSRYPAEREEQVDEAQYHGAGARLSAPSNRDAASDLGRGHSIYKDRALGSVPERTELMPSVEVVKDKRGKLEKNGSQSKNVTSEIYPHACRGVVEHLTTSDATTVARD